MNKPIAKKKKSSELGKKKNKVTHLRLIRNNPSTAVLCLLFIFLHVYASLHDKHIKIVSTVE